MMRIGIIGLGFVGGAMLKSFQIRNEEWLAHMSNAGHEQISELGYEFIGYDKYKDGGIGTLESCLETDLLFLSLPTPYRRSQKGYCHEPFEEILGFLQVEKYEGLVIVKSTLAPETTENFTKKYGLAMMHNPEFLTARTAFDDFHHQSHIILGRGSQCSQKQLNLVNTFYQRLYPDASISHCTATESETTKLYLNNFYAMKVQIFNEFYLGCQSSGADYERVKEMMLKNNWINPMHTTVPGPGGGMSYSGACFPKDTNALRDYLERKQSPHAVLKATIEERDGMRDDNPGIVD